MLRLACDFGVYIFVRLLVRFVQTLTLDACQRGVRPLAWLFADVLRIRHTIVDENLRQAFPDSTLAQRQQTNRSMWEHLLLMGCELVHMPRKVHHTNWREHVRLLAVEPQVRAFISPRPCIMISGHFGNFEAGNYLNGLFGFRTHTIARPLDNPFLDRWMTALRQSRGQTMLPKHDVAKQVALLLDEGENIALLGDQFGGESGCWIDFFGRPASYHKAIALFSITSGAPLLVGFVRRAGGKALQIEIGVESAYDPTNATTEFAGVREVTQWYNDALEAIVRRDPEQYWWLHKRYKGTPKQRTKRKNRAQKSAA